MKSSARKKNADVQYILMGLLIGGGAAALLLAGAFAAGVFPRQASKPKAANQPAFALAAPTFTPVPAPTETSIPTQAAIPAPDWDSILARQIVQELPAYGGEWHILIRRDGSQTVFAYRAGEKNHVASIIKIAFAMLFFKSLEARGIQPSQYQEYLSTRGIGRTYKQLLRAMLVESEELAAKTLREATRQAGIDESAALQAWGAPHTDLSKRTSTAEDIAALYESLYYGRALNPEARAVILNYLSEYTPNDDSRLGILRGLLPPGAKFYNKRGSITEGRLVIGDSALLSWEEDGTEKVYVLVALGYNGETPTTDKKLTRGIEMIAFEFWKFIVLQPR